MVVSKLSRGIGFVEKLLEYLGTAIFNEFDGVLEIAWDDRNFVLFHLEKGKKKLFASTWNPSSSRKSNSTDPNSVEIALTCQQESVASEVVF